VWSCRFGRIFELSRQRLHVHGHVIAKGTNALNIPGRRVGKLPLDKVVRGGGEREPRFRGDEVAAAARLLFPI
jgi:hypothetical protein